MEIKALDAIQQQNTTSTYSTVSNSSTNISMWGIDIKDKGTEESKLSVKDKIAKVEGYTQTANANLYYSKAENVYYRWNDQKSKFVKQKDITDVFDTGYCKTKKGSYLDPNGNLFVKKEKTYLQPMNDYGCNLPNVMATVYGLDKTKKSFVFFDKKENCYKTWDKDKSQFVKSDITAVTDDAYYQIGDKYYDALGETLDAETFLASKNGYVKTNQAGVYSNWPHNGIFYKWNKDTKTFEEFGAEVDKQKQLQEKSDGEISTIRQGDRGDCWLLSSVYGISEENKELFKELIKVDENGNTTINLKGPNKSYTITKEELDEAIKTKTYAAGDRDIVAFEIAFERFRKENIEQNRITGANYMSMYHLSGYSESDYLCGGIPRNAIETLTGKKVTSLVKTNEEGCYLQDNVVKLGRLDEKNVSKILDNSKNLVVVSLDDPDPHGEAHAYTYKSQDEENIYLVNPYDTSKVEAIKKEEFYSKLLQIDYTDFSSPIDVKLSNARYMRPIESAEVKKYKLSH